MRRMRANNPIKINSHHPSTGSLVTINRNVTADAIVPQKVELLPRLQMGCRLVRALSALGMEHLPGSNIDPPPKGGIWGGGSFVCFKHRWRCVKCCYCSDIVLNINHLLKVIGAFIFNRRHLTIYV